MNKNKLIQYQINLVSVFFSQLKGGGPWTKIICRKTKKKKKKKIKIIIIIIIMIIMIMIKYSNKRF